MQIKSAKSNLSKALEKDGHVSITESLSLYKKAAENCLQMSKAYPRYQTELRTLALKAIERAEVLKKEALCGIRI